MPIYILPAERCRGMENGRSMTAYNSLLLFLSHTFPLLQCDIPPTEDSPSKTALPRSSPQTAWESAHVHEAHSLPPLTLVSAGLFLTLFSLLSLRHHLTFRKYVFA